MASALIASMEDLNRPDDDPEECDRRASALVAAVEYDDKTSQEFRQIVSGPTPG
jgi:hypothetical protein